MNTHDQLPATQATLSRPESDRRHLLKLAGTCMTAFGALGVTSLLVGVTRAYIDELPPDVLEGRIQPGRVFDRAISLEQVPDGYRAMDQRESIKVMIDF